jgi:hypothetical protein
VPDWGVEKRVNLMLLVDEILVNHCKAQPPSTQPACGHTIFRQTACCKAGSGMVFLKFRELPCLPWANKSADYRN